MYSGYTKGVTEELSLSNEHLLSLSPYGPTPQLLLALKFIWSGSSTMRYECTSFHYKILQKNIDSPI